MITSTIGGYALRYPAYTPAVIVPRLAVPRNLRQTSTTSDSNTLAWDAVPDADGYLLRNKTTGTTYAVAATSYQETGLLATTNYSYDVGAQDSSGGYRASAYSAPVVARTAAAAAAQVGTIFARTDFTDLSGLSLGTGVSVSNGKLLTTAGQVGIVTRTMVSALTEYELRETFVLQANDTGNFGHGINLNSVNTAVNNSLSFYIFTHPSNPADFGKLVIYDTYANASYVGPVVPGFGLNVETTLRVVKTKEDYTFYAQAGSNSEASLTRRILYQSTAGDMSTNTFQVQLGSPGSTGQVLISEFTYTSSMLVNSRVLGGDSIDYGFNAAGSGNRYGELMAAQIQAGPGDRTREVVLRLPETLTILRPSKYFLKIGTNQLNDQAYHDDLATIFLACANAGVPLVFLTPPARRGIDMSGHRNYIATTYPNNYIDLYNATKAATSTDLRADLDSDGTHQNPLGHSVMAQTVMASPLY